MKKFTSRLLCITLATALIALCLSSCTTNLSNSKGNATASEGTVSSAPPTEMITQELKTGTLIEGTSDKTVYPWLNPGGVVLSASYRTLLMADSALTDVKPDLATSHTVSEDKLTYTFVIKDGQKWSDGEPLTAKDVAYSLKSILKVASSNAIFTTAFSKIVGATEWKEGTANELKGVTVDANKITINLTAAYGAFLETIAQLVILPEHATKDIDVLELHNNDYWKNPVTSGAFKLGEMSAGNFYTLVPNENYDGTPWKITKITNYYIPDYITASQSGNLDYFFSNSPEVIGELEKLPDMSKFPIDVLFYRYFICNIKGSDGNINPVMQDVRVREALLYAIDRDTLAAQLFPGLATVLNSGIPNDYTEYNGKKYEYNPEKAKQLLKEANYDFNHTFRILYYYTDQTTIDFMDAIAFYLSEIGMKVETTQSQQGNKDLYTLRNYDIGYKGLSAFSIAEWYGEYLSTNTNLKNIFGGGTEFDENALAIAAETDPAKRSELMKKLQGFEQEKLYKLPLYTIGNNVFINTGHVKIPDGVTFGNPYYIHDLKFEEWEIVKN